MSDYGVQSTGFVKKPLSVIKQELEDAFRAVFGPGFNLTPQSPMGQFIGIISDSLSQIWEGKEAVYNSQYPATSEGINLDNVAAITGSVRKQATLSVVNSGVGRGTFGTTIPAGTIISVVGNSSARFVTDADTDIDVAAIQQVQTIVLDADLVTGNTFSIDVDGATISEVFVTDHDTTMGNIAAAIQAEAGVATAVVGGAGNRTITVTAAVGGTDVLLENESITGGASQAGIVITETVAGDKAKTAAMNLTAETSGAVAAPSGSLTVIETPVVGLDEYTNTADAILGNDVEEDPEFKLRRAQELQIAGSATIEAIISELSQVAGVTAVKVFENITDTTDAVGRPPHSIDAVVEGGTNADIAQAIFDTIAAGIDMFGSITESVFDSQGFEKFIKFSRPTVIEIFLQIDVTTNSSYPLDGDDQVKQAIEDYGDELTIGDDVIVFGSDALICAIDEIPGITDVLIKIAVASILASGSDTFVGSDDGGDLLLTAAGHPLAVGHKVTFSTTGTLPQGLENSGKIFWVVDVSGDDFKVSETRGGSIVPFLDAGSGTHTVSYGSTDDNIVIEDREIANFDQANMTVNQV